MSRAIRIFTRPHFHTLPIISTIESNNRSAPPAAAEPAAAMYRRNMGQQHYGGPPPPPRFQRAWENGPPGVPLNNNDDSKDCRHLDITVMSYNVLAQNLIDVHANLYAGHHPRHLHFPHRFELIVAHVARVQPDVLCLQEMQRCHLALFANALRAAANLTAYVYQKRTSDQHLDGCATFYRTDRVQLRAAHRVEYEQPLQNAQKSTAPAPPLLDRPNVAVLTHFQAPGRPAVQFVVANTHLLFNPKREDVRVAQTQILLAELDRFAYLGERKDDEKSSSTATTKAVHAPCIIMGDFNASPQSATVELLTTGRLAYAQRSGTRLIGEADGDGEAAASSSKTKRAYGVRLLPYELAITDDCQHGAMAGTGHPSTAVSSTWLHNSRCNRISNAAPNVDQMLQSGLPFRTGTLRHQFELRSVYADVAAHSATTFHDNWLTVDYILYSARAQNDALRLVSRLRLPSVEECMQHIGTIPNEEHGSDHISLAARFRVGESPVDELEAVAAAADADS